MKNTKLLAICMMSAALLLGACGKKEKEATSTSTSQASSSVSSSSSSTKASAKAKKSSSQASSSQATADYVVTESGDYQAVADQGQATSAVVGQDSQVANQASGDTNQVATEAVAPTRPQVTGDFSAIAGTWANDQGMTHTFDASGQAGDHFIYDADLASGDYVGGIGYVGGGGAVFVYVPAGQSIASEDLDNYGIEYEAVTDYDRIFSGHGIDMYAHPLTRQ